MGDHENNPPELPNLRLSHWPPEVVQMFLRIPQSFYLGPFQGQPIQDNVTPPPHPHSPVQQPFPEWGDPSGVPDPPESNALWNPSQPVLPPPPDPGPAQVEVPQVEAPLVQEDDVPEYHPPEFVAPAAAPVQDQGAGLDAPGAGVDNPRCPCPICGRTFKRCQERNRHLRSYLPHFIHCPFPDCRFRCDRPHNLANHWGKKHRGQAPQQQQCEIYNPGLLVTWVVSGRILMEHAINFALWEVNRRAQELGKEGAWAGDLWGRRRMRLHVFEQ